MVVTPPPDLLENEVNRMGDRESLGECLLLRCVVVVVPSFSTRTGIGLRCRSPSLPSPKRHLP
ncbi:hypothetical protein WCLP8_260007 [uncultured Gammaproteobacteria bacterium]